MRSGTRWKRRTRFPMWSGRPTTLERRSLRQKTPLPSSRPTPRSTAAASFSRGGRRPTPVGRGRFGAFLGEGPLAGGLARAPRVGVAPPRARRSERRLCGGDARAPSVAVAARRPRSARRRQRVGPSSVASPSVQPLRRAWCDANQSSTRAASDFAPSFARHEYENATRGRVVASGRKASLARTTKKGQPPPGRASRESARNAAQTCAPLRRRASPLEEVSRRRVS